MGEKIFPKRPIKRGGVLLRRHKRPPSKVSGDNFLEGGGR